MERKRDAHTWRYALFRRNKNPRNGLIEAKGKKKEQHLEIKKNNFGGEKGPRKKRRKGQ